jgi:hypothetical protein
MSVSFSRNEIPASCALGSLDDGRSLRRGLNVLRLLIPATKRHVHVLLFKFEINLIHIFKNLGKIELSFSTLSQLYSDFIIIF